MQIKKQQEHARSLLQSRNIAFDLVDITVSSVTLGYMREQSGQKDLPQLFVGGEFRGVRFDGNTQFIVQNDYWNPDF